MSETVHMHVPCTHTISDVVRDHMHIDSTYNYTCICKDIQTLHT